MHHHHDIFAAIVGNPLDLAPQAESGAATNPALLLTIKTNRGYGCKMRKHEFPNFYFEIMIFFKWHSFTPTTTWLMSHPPGGIWRCRCWHPAGNNTNDQGMHAKGEKKCISHFILLWNDLIFSTNFLQHDRTMIDISAARLTLEMPLLPPNCQQPKLIVTL